MNHAVSMFNFIASAQRRAVARLFLDQDSLGKLSDLNEFKNDVCIQNGIDPENVKMHVENMRDLPVAAIYRAKHKRSIIFAPEVIKEGDLDVLKFIVAHEIGHDILLKYYEIPEPVGIVIRPDKIAYLKNKLGLIPEVIEALRNTKNDAVILKREELAVDAIAVIQFPTIGEGLRALQKAMPFLKEMVTRRTPWKDKIPQCYRPHPMPRTRSRIAQWTFGQ